jgi:hypothetical protein
MVVDYILLQLLWHKLECFNYVYSKVERWAI